MKLIIGDAFLMLDGRLIFSLEISHSSEFTLKDLRSLLIVFTFVVEGKDVLCDKTIALAVTLVESYFFQNQGSFSIAWVLAVRS